MFDPDDTIVAIATPAGRGGIGVVRISGPEAARIAAAITRREAPLQPRHATLARVQGRGGLSDQAVLTYFPAPHSYTAEDVVEISAHGSPVLLRAIVEASMHAGARLAEPGEFTFRAFLRGRIDLVQAEAVRDLVDAVTPVQARAAFDQLEGTLTARIQVIDAQLFDLAARLEASLDFPEEGYHFVEAGGAAGALRELGRSVADLLQDAQRGRLVREGAQVAIVGRPNAGKSSLFNALAGAGRAIVTDVPGTTRDLLTEIVEIEGIPVTLVDTAGLRSGPADAVEAEGIARARAAHSVAQAAIVVIDSSRPLGEDDRRLLAETAGQRRVVIASKADVPAVWTRDALPDVALVPLSVVTGEGLQPLRVALAETLAGAEPLRDAPAITNARHVELLRRARHAIGRAADAAASGASEEFVLADVGAARAALEEVTGARTAEDVLRAIFEKFCIGK